MRALAIGVIALAAAAGAVLAAVAATPGYPSGPYQIYIFDTDDRHSTIYAIEVDGRAGAAMVQECVGRLLDDPEHVVADLRERAARDDAPGVVWLEGRGSRVSLGSCGEEDVNEEDVNEGEDAEDGESLVVVRDASAPQTRRLIGEIHGLPAAEQNAMIHALGLDRRTRAQR